MRRLTHLDRYPILLVLALAGLLALALTLLTIDLVRLTLANLDFLRRFGTMGLKDGGLLQLLTLAAKGATALLCYFGFKLCEMDLIRRYTAWQHRK